MTPEQHFLTLLAGCGNEELIQVFIDWQYEQITNKALKEQTNGKGKH